MREQQQIDLLNRRTTISNRLLASSVLVLTCYILSVVYIPDLTGASKPVMIPAAANISGYDITFDSGNDCVCGMLYLSENKCFLKAVIKCGYDEPFKKLKEIVIAELRMHWPLASLVHYYYDESRTTYCAFESNKYRPDFIDTKVIIRGFISLAILPIVYFIWYAVSYIIETRRLIFLALAEEESDDNISIAVSLPSRPYDAVIDALWTCVICLESNTANNENIIVLKCNHKFHKKCLDTWITTKRTNLTCPCCRQNIIT